jgi:putative ABC transport system permease protein
MSFASAIRVALAALLVNKGRSVLTSLGIVIGISAVIAMVSAGSSAWDLLNNRLESVGKNLILVRAGARTQQGTASDYIPLNSDDAVAIRSRVGPLLVDRKVAESQSTKKVVTSRNVNHTTSLVGTTPDVVELRKWKVVFGRFFNSDEVKNQAPVCVLGETVRQKLFESKANPCGETIRVEGHPLRVIGVLEPKGRSPLGTDQDDQVFLPLSTLQWKLVGEKKITMIMTAVQSEDQLQRAKDEIIKVMRDRHHLKKGDQDDFDVSTVQEMAQLAVILTKTMQVLIAIIASISLVVGGIGIMNIMLVSVTERTREIGIRMAVGAKPGDVLIQFLIEAVVLSLVGGILGIVLGLAGAAALAHLANWEMKTQPHFVLLAFAVSAGVGIFFGYYPAMKASRLDPIEALRYE